jgi:hypothetical protein
MTKRRVFVSSIRRAEATRPAARADVAFQSFMQTVLRPLNAWGLNTVWTEEKLLARLHGSNARAKFDTWRARMLATARDA